ncbi:MAG TPA: 50S ribosomal protein L11 methyltransferase [Candidatus Binataceae bacterium]|nr:50S ribosomal protein L11 methyltransferase [Candidatus Binataceae bacterium]
MSAARKLPSPTYYRVALQVSAADADELGGVLIGLGAMGSAAKWARRMPRAGHKIVTLESYFQRLSAARWKAIVSGLKQAGLIARKQLVAPPELIVDPGWAAMWKERFKPLPIGRHLLLLPPWEAGRSDGKRLEIIIDPGQGFGTGHHPSTRGTLLAIEHEVGRGVDGPALDLGSGSGVLAIAMRRLGVDEVCAVEIDPAARANARHNASLNRLSRDLRFAAELKPGTRFGLIAANILASTLIELAPILIQRLAPGGRLILSGILEREAPRVLARYRPQLRLRRSYRERGWVTLTLGAAAGHRAARETYRGSSLFRTAHTHI